MKSIQLIGIEKQKIWLLYLYFASDWPKWVTGAEFTIDGGVTAQ